MEFLYENDKITGFKSRVFNEIYWDDKVEDTLSTFFLDYSDYDFSSTDGIDKYEADPEKEITYHPGKEEGNLPKKVWCA